MRPLSSMHTHFHSPTQHNRSSFGVCVCVLDEARQTNSTHAPILTQWLSQTQFECDYSSIDCWAHTQYTDAHERARARAHPFSAQHRVLCSIWHSIVCQHFTSKFDTRLLNDCYPQCCRVVKLEHCHSECVSTRPTIEFATELLNEKVKTRLKVHAIPIGRLK